MPSGPDLIGPVFGLLCRLAADRRQAEWLTARVLASSVSPSQALDEARRLYLLDSATTASGPRGDDPVSAMTPEARVADERNPDSPNAALWHGRDLWLDDDTRHRIGELVRTVPAPASGDSGGETGGGLPAAPLMSPGRKRTLIVSAGLTLAVLAAMVASSAIGSDSDALGEDGFSPTSATTDSSESPDTTDDTDDTETTETTDDTRATVPFTVVVETTIRESLGPPGFILDDDPDGMQFAGAWENGGPGGGGMSGWVQLWASPDADRNAGRWAVIATADGRAGFYCCDVRLDGTRLDINGAPALLSASPDGVVDVMTVTTEQEQINIRSYGLTTDEMATLIAGIAAEGNEEPVLDAAALTVLDGSRQVMSRQGGWGRADGAMWDDTNTRGVSFVEVAQPHGYAWISTTTATPSSMLAARLLQLRPSIDVAPGGTVTIAGHEVLVSIDQPPDEQPLSYQLQYVDGEDFVSVGGQVDFGTLVTIVSDAHRASDNQWRHTLARDPAQIDVSSTGPTPMQPRFTSAGTTEIGDARWEIAVSTDPRAVQVSFSSDQFSGGGPFAELNIDERPIQYLTTLEVSLVVVVLADVEAGSSIQFTPPGGAPTLVPLREMSDETYSAASFAYSEYGPCLVQLVDASGAIVGELPSS